MESENDIFCKSVAFGRSFTREDWAAFWRDCHENKKEPIVTDVSGFNYNVHDCCLNPDVIHSTAHRGVLFEWKIKTSCWRGRWFWGADYNFDNRGGGFGCWLGDSGHNTQSEAIKAAATYLYNSKSTTQMSDNSRDELKQYIEIKSKPIQLSLF